MKYNVLKKFDEVNEELERLGRDYRLQFCFMDRNKRHIPCTVAVSINQKKGRSNPVIYSFDWMEQEKESVIAFFDELVEESNARVDWNKVYDVDYIREHTIPVLASAERADEFNENGVVFTDVENTDMIMHYVIDMADAIIGDDANKEDYCVKVLNGFLNRASVSKEELHKYAISHMGKICDCISLFKYMERYYGSDFVDEQFVDDENIVFATNKEDFWGAASIFTDEMQDILEKKLGSRYIVCPEDVHKFVCVKWDGNYDVLIMAKSIIEKGTYLKENRVSENVYIMEDRKLRMYVE